MGFDLAGTSHIPLNKERGILKNATLNMLKQALEGKLNGELKPLTDPDNQYLKPLWKNKMKLEQMEGDDSVPRVFERLPIKDFEFFIGYKSSGEASGNYMREPEFDELLLFLSKTRLTLFAERSDDVAVIELFHGKLPIYVLKSGDPHRVVLEKSSSNVTGVTKYMQREIGDRIDNLMERLPEDVEFRLFLLVNMKHEYKDKSKGSIHSTTENANTENTERSQTDGENETNNKKNMEDIYQRRINNVASLVGVFCFKKGTTSQYFDKLFLHITNPNGGFYLHLCSFFDIIKKENFAEIQKCNDKKVKRNCGNRDQSSHGQSSNQSRSETFDFHDFLSIGEKDNYIRLQVFMILLAWYLVAKPFRCKLLGEKFEKDHSIFSGHKFFHSIFNLRNNLFSYSINLTVSNKNLFVPNSTKISDGKYILDKDSQLAYLLAYIFVDYLDMYSEKVPFSMRINDSKTELSNACRIDFVNNTILYEEWKVKIEPLDNVRVKEDQVDLYEWQTKWNISWSVFATGILSILSETMILMNKRIDRYLDEYENMGLKDRLLRSWLAFGHLHEIMAKGAQDFSDFFNIDILQNYAYNQLFETFKETSGINEMYERLIERVKMFAEYEAQKHLQDLTYVGVILSIILVFFTLITVLMKFHVF